MERADRNCVYDCMTWIIGDIHGCLEELDQLLRQIPHDDKLVFTGDYIDRGPDSKGTIDRLLEEKHRSVFLMGNHEDMLLQYYTRSPYNGSAWMMEANGGRKTLESYGMALHSKFTDLPLEHQNFYKNLILFYQEKDFAVVHAGVNVDHSSDLNYQRRDDLLWIRGKWFKNESKWGGKYLYFGHTPVSYMNADSNLQSPWFGRNSCGLDTGCVYGGFLTAMHHPSREVLQVKSRFDGF